MSINPLPQTSYLHLFGRNVYLMLPLGGGPGQVTPLPPPLPSYHPPPPPMLPVFIAHGTCNTNDRKVSLMT